MQILKKQFSIKRYPLSLTHAVLLTLLATVSVVLITVYAFLYYEGYAFFDEVSENILSAKKATIEAAIHEYIDVPIQSNAIIVHAIGREEGDSIAVRSLIGEMVNNINNVFTEKQYLNVVEFGGVNGDFVQIAHDKHRTHDDYLTLKDAGTHHKLMSFHHLSPDSAVEQIMDNYDIYQRAWFTSAEKDRNPHWIKPFMIMNIIGRLPSRLARRRLIARASLLAWYPANCISTNSIKICRNSIRFLKACC
jgi:hypothetical protein